MYIIIRGPLGCGKSTIAERIAKELNAQYIPVDRVLDEHNLFEWEDGYISQESFKKANEIMANEIQPVLDKGRTVVFDGNFYWRSQIDDLIERLPYEHKVFTLKAPLEVCIERDGAREKTHGKDAAEAVYKKSTSFTYGMVIDIDRPIEECMAEIKKYL